MFIHVCIILHPVSFFSQLHVLAVLIGDCRALGRCRARLRLSILRLTMDSET